MHRRATTIHIQGEVESNSEAKHLAKLSGDLVIVKRGKVRSAVLKCPCGCGDVLVINLDYRIGPAWTLYERNTKYTFYPSVWRESGCKSHFIIWDSRIYWFDYRSSWEERDNPELDQKVIDSFKVNKLQHYKDIADRLDEIPWEILRSCRRLAKKGLLSEKKGKDNHGIFDLTK